VTLVGSMDPDIWNPAVSLFVDGKLHRAGIAKSELQKGEHDAATCLAAGNAVAWWFAALGVTRLDAFVYEWPVVLDATHQKGSKRLAKPNDLLPLPGVCVAAAAHFRSAQLVKYLPQEWKGGSIEKVAMCTRVWRRLTAEEKIAVERRPRGGGLEIDGTKGLSDDTLDAIGIGLRFLDRLERERCFY